MNDLFCNYTQALALKELGFDETCFGCFTKSGELSYDFSDNKDEGHYFQDCAAPLKQQVFKWFRDEHHLFADIYECVTGGFKDNIVPKDWKPECRWKIYKPVGITYSQKDKVLVHVSDNLYRDFYYYEEAESACIDNLIELIKEKKS
jgi:hypothetical protein